MFRDRAHILSRRAAQEIRQDIRRDRRGASAQLGPVLDHIAESFLDHRLQIATLRQACGIGDDAMASLFARDLGCTPLSYITECRMKLAVRLLTGTDLKSWQIGTAIGYTSGGSFGRAFKSWSGQTPGVYRKAPENLGNAEPVASGLLGDGELRQALAGELAEDEAEILLNRIEGIRDGLLTSYPGLRSPPVPLAAPVPGAELVERSMAEILWRRIQRLPFAEQRALIAGQVAFSTPALFDLLSEKSYTIGSHDRTASIEVANLARESLETLAGRLGSQLPSYKAQAWSTVGTAKARAGDYGGAEQAFTIAEQQLALAGDAVDPVVMITVCLNKATLLIHLEDVLEADRLVSIALRVLQALVERLGFDMQAFIDTLEPDDRALLQEQS